MTEWGLDDKDVMWWRCPTHMEVNSYRECSQCKKELKKRKLTEGRNNMTNRFMKTNYEISIEKLDSGFLLTESWEEKGDYKSKKHFIQYAEDLGKFVTEKFEK